MRSSSSHDSLMLMYKSSGGCCILPSYIYQCRHLVTLFQYQFACAKLLPRGKYRNTSITSSSCPGLNGRAYGSKIDVYHPCPSEVVSGIKILSYSVVLNMMFPTNTFQKFAPGCQRLICLVYYV